MRIIAGKNKSRKLETLEGMNTRPMTDRMKESVFNCIGPYFENDNVLDLFGGSGALSLESLSRGAKHAWICEKSFDALKIIKKNVINLKEENNVTIYNTDYQVALNRIVNEKVKFDIIFLDPPFRMNIVEELVEYIMDNNLINERGVIVCQYVKGNMVPSEKENLRIIKNYNYGTSELTIYQFISKEEEK